MMIFSKSQNDHKISFAPAIEQRQTWKNCGFKSIINFPKWQNNLKLNSKMNLNEIDYVNFLLYTWFCIKQGRFIQDLLFNLTFDLCGRLAFNLDKYCNPLSASPSNTHVHGQPVTNQTGTCNTSAQIDPTSHLNSARHWSVSSVLRFSYQSGTSWEHFHNKYQCFTSGHFSIITSIVLFCARIICMDYQLVL